MKKTYFLVLLITISLQSVAQQGWQQLSSGTTHLLNSTYFLNVNTGIIAGDSGIVLKTNNSGINWNMQILNTHYHLYSAFFTDPNTAYVCGDSDYASGIIFKTVNGGSNWIQVYNAPQTMLASIYFNDLYTGYATGYQGTILKTTNAGISWNQLSSGTNFPIYSIYFSSVNTGYAAGGIFDIQGMALKTTNGGLNWSNQYITAEPLNSVYFLNDMTGYAAGGDFEFGTTIFRTSNGGISWTQQNQPEFGMIRCITFPTPDTGYCTGVNFSEISKTINGGSSWFTQYTGNNSSPNNLFMLNSLTGYAVGSNGLILKTTDGGSPPFLIGVTDTNTLTPLLYWSKVQGALTYSLQISLDAIFNNIILSANNILDTFYRIPPPGLLWNACFYVRVKSDTGSWSNVFYFCIHSHSVSGTVRYQDNSQLVTHGYVKALKLDRITLQVITVDSTNIQSNGTYNLIHMPQDSLDIMAYGDDENDFVPTYHDSTIYWQNAHIIYPTSNLSNIDVKVYRINQTPSQIHIGGCVFTSAFSLTGLKDAIVYAKLGNQFKRFSITSQSGNYRLDSLPQGSYQIICDRMGYDGGSKNIPLSVNLDTVNFYLNNIIAVDPFGTPIPTSFILYQNYPNPINPSTTIRFALPKSSIVKLVIYDVLGKEVIKLVDEQLNPGTYKVDWNASNYASGLYFYKLTANDFAETKKLVLIK